MTADDKRTRHTFQAIAAPEGHRRCELVIIPDDGREFICECKREFQSRADIEEHHKRERELLAGVLQ